MGSGSLYGTFGPPSQILDTDASLGAKSGRPATAPEPRRNIYVAAAKTGSYGSPWQDRTIGGHTLEYMQDEYCRGRILEKVRVNRQQKETHSTESDKKTGLCFVVCGAGAGS